MAKLFFDIFSNDAAALGFLDSTKRIPYTYNCFGTINIVYDGDDSDGNLYIGFLAHDDIVKLVEEINEQFSNIKVILIGKKFINNASATDDFHSSYRSLPDPFPPYWLFKVLLSDQYNKESKYILTLTIAEFIRAYCPYYSIYDKMICVRENYIDSCLEIQNTTSYGAWLCCDPQKQSCSRETFNKLDDVELLNSLTAGNIDFDTMPSIHRLIRVLDGSKPKSYITRSGEIWR